MPGSSIPLMKPRNFYRIGCYLLLYSQDDQPIGLARALKIPFDQTEELGYKKYIKSIPFLQHSRHVGIFTDVGVLRQYRKTFLRYGNNKITIGQAIILVLCKTYLEGVQVLFGSASISGAYKFFTSLGAYLLGLRSDESRIGQCIADFVILLGDRNKLTQKKSPLLLLSRPDNTYDKQLTAHLIMIDKSCMASIQSRNS